MAHQFPYIDTSHSKGSDTIANLRADYSEFGVDSSLNLNVSGVGTFTNTVSLGATVNFTGSLTDDRIQVGAAGSILSSTGSGIRWIAANTTSVDNASKVGTNLDGTNANQWVAFIGASSGNNPVRIDNDLRYNPSTNILTTGGIDIVDNGETRFGTNNDLKISHTNSLSGQNDSNGDSVLAGTNWCSYINETGTGPLIFKSDGGPSTGAFQFYDTGWRPILKLFSGNSARAALYHAGEQKLVTTGTGVDITNTLNVSGLSTFSSVNVSGVATISGSGGLDVTNNLDVGGDMDVDGTTDLDVLNVSETATFTGNVVQNDTDNHIRINGELRDKDGQSGTSGQVLSSTGSQIDWINVGDISAGSASQVAISDNSTDDNQFVNFSAAKSGNNAIRANDNVRYNPNSGTLSATKFSGELDGTASVSNITISGNLKDKDGQAGSSGQVLSSTGSQIDWVNVGDLSAGAASQVAVSDNSTNASQYVNFTSAKSGNNSVRANDSLRFNPNNGTLSATTFSGSGASLTTLNGSNISSGTVAAARVATLNQNTTGTAGGLSGTPSISITNLTISGSITDKDSSTGSSGQVLSSTGSQVDWINVGDISAGSASQVAVSDDSNANADRFIVFSASNSGNNSLKSDGGLKYNPSTNRIASQITDVSNHDTDDISEGSSNLYHTTARARGSISASGSVSYNSSTGVISYSQGNSDSVSEGSSNLYHTTARARGAISASGDLSYNSSTGVMSITVPSSFVTGMIIIWSGSSGSIPSGWVLCNGSNSTPDLRNRFVVGAGDSYSVDDTGGSNTVTLSTANLPSHTHSFSGSASHSHTIDNHTHSFSGSASHSHTINNHTHSFSGSGSASHSHTINNHTHSWSGNTNTTGNHNHHESGGSGYNHEDSERGWARTTGDHGDFNHATDGNHSHSVSGTTGNPSNRGTDSKSVSISISGTTGNPSNTGTNSQSVSISGTTGNPSDRDTNSQSVSISGTTGGTGSGDAHENRPPYYALCYIMKT